MTGGQWYWPTETPVESKWRINDPRYDNLRDAVVASLKMHHGEIYVWVMQRGRTTGIATEAFAGLRVTDMFNDPDFLEEGVIEQWWATWVRGLKTTTLPRVRKHSDESLG